MAKSLLEAVYDQDLDEIKTLLRTRSPDQLDEYRRTPLYAAVTGTEPSVVHILLEAGADPNRESEGLVNGTTDGTPLSAAATWGKLDAARALLAHGADPNLVSHGWPPLVWAARSGHHETVQLLLEARADPNLGAPIVYAAEYGSLRVVRVLLDSGADPDATDPAGRSALDVSEEWASKDLEAALHALARTCRRKEAEIVSWREPRPDGVEAVFVEAGWDGGAMVWERETGHAKIVELLRSRGTDSRSADD